jgi:predicted amidohydrolase
MNGMPGGHIKAAALQFAVTMDIAQNIEALETTLERLESGVLAVAPEGSLSGYLPEPNFVSQIDRAATDRAIERMAVVTRQRQIHLVAGACIFKDGAWLNSALYFGPNGETARYDKINLAGSERGTFSAGNMLPVFDITVAEEPLRLGIQMCREIRYPEQWRALAAQARR